MKKARLLIAVLVAFGPAIEAADNVSKPDIFLRKKLNAPSIGKDVYNLNGAGQTIRKVKTNRRGKGKWFFTAEHDGSADDTIGVRATRKNRKFNPTYIQIAPFKGNVTGAVSNGTYLTESLVPGESVDFKAKVKPRSKFKSRRAKKTFSITLTGTVNGTKDVGKAKVKKKP